MAGRPRRRRGQDLTSQPTSDETLARSWGVQVARFGKVANASIEDAPLLMLLGKNNTGKSYIATLMWTIRRLDFLRGPEGIEGRPSWFKAFMRSEAKGEFTSQIVIGETERKDIVDHLNAVLRDSGGRHFSSIFAFEGFEDASVSVIPQTLNSNITATISREQIKVNQEGEAQQKMTAINFVIKDEIGEVLASLEFTEYSNDLISFYTAIIYQTLVRIVVFETIAGGGSPSNVSARRKDGLNARAALADFTDIAELRR